MTRLSTFHRFNSRQQALLMISLKILWKHLFSDVFNRDWYTEFYMLEANQKRFPFLFYAFYGVFKNHAPHPDFHPESYIKSNPDVLSYDNLIVIHYLLFGYKENRKIHDRLPVPNTEDYPYQTYIDTHEGEWQISQPIENGPLFSILCPVHSVPLVMLRHCIDSVRKQTYTNWELCLTFSDPDNEDNRSFLYEQATADSRIRVKEISNQGISANTNEALAMATGEYICLLDHDDMLTAHALEVISRAIRKNPLLDFLYSDKDRLNHATGQRFHPLCKPEWSPEILYSANYLTHFNIMRRSLVEKIGGFRPKTDGAQDWDIFLRITELTNAIQRIPHILYHWRVHMRSTSSGMEAKPYAQAAQLTTLQDAVIRRNLPATVAFRDTHYMHVEWSSVAHIPVHILIDGTGYPQAQVAQLIQLVSRELQDTSVIHGRISVIHSLATETEFPESDNPFTHVRCGNHHEMASIVEHLVSTPSDNNQVLVFLNGGIDAIRKGWLTELVGWAGHHPDIGFCGGFVLNAQQQITSSLLLLSERGAWIDLFQGYKRSEDTLMGDVRWYRNCSAVLPNIVAVKRAALPETGAFQTDISWHASFVKACQAMRTRGFRGLLNPWVVAHSVELQSADSSLDYTFRADPYFHPAVSAIAPLSLLRRNVQSTSLRQPDQYNMESLSIAASFPFIRTKSDRIRNSVQKEQIRERNEKPVCRWFIPDIQNPYYGGALTIFRFADYLSRHKLIENQFIVISNDDTTALQSKIRTLFPTLSATDCINLPQFDMQNSSEPCINIATLWTTAYVIKNRVREGLFFYFIQDFEPAFYPAGSLYAMAEHSYRMGFYTIANTRYLLDIQMNSYKGKGTYFTPQVDTGMFYPAEQIIHKRQSRRIFFYARPQHPRNGFELAVTALRLLKKHLGNEVEIICAGEEFDVDAFGLQGIVTSVGILGYQETAELYRSCDIGFTLMLSRHPSYLPMELMASGALLVTNFNEASEWLLKDNENCLLSWAVPELLAQRLADAVIHYESYQTIRQHGVHLIHSTLNDWESAFEGAGSYIQEQWRNFLLDT